MLFQIKQYFKFLFSSVVFWTIALSLFIVIRYYAIDRTQANGFNSSYEIIIEEWLQFVLILGIIIGAVFGSVEYVFYRFLSKRLNVIIVIISKSIIYLILLIFSLSFISHFIEMQMGLDLPNETGWWKTSRTFWLVAGYFFMCSFFFLFIKMVNDKFGRGQLFNMLIGRYRRPREMKRIFMFLDLKSSTTIAEEIGHYKYSQLIQDCFFDLNKIVSRHDANIYQYVGDEAVLTWSYKSGIKNNNCINLFFHYELAIMRRSKYYRKRYNLVPQFKAGIHGGDLIVVEVGSIKKEIAYHGDVINTTSRIQGKCNEFEKSLLISEDLIKEIKLNPKYEKIHIGELLLEGKQEPVRLFAIDRNRPSDK